MKQKKITHPMQKVAADILCDLEILVMTHNGPYTFEEIWNIVKHHEEKYGLFRNPFTSMICTSEEWWKSNAEYARQTAEEKYECCDWLD
jgi:hypothetical protein